MENEIWKDIIGYEGYYQISNLGRVKSFKKHNGTNERILKNSFNKLYNFITLYKNSNRKIFLIHRLVATNFILNLLGKKEVNHINGIKTDNRVENLEWCTKSENELHKYRILGHKSFFETNNPNPNKGKFGKENHSSKKVDQYSLDGEFIKTWDCISDIQRELGINKSNISQNCKLNPKVKSVGGFIWKN